MCLGVPGRIAATWEADGLRMGEVDFGGVTKDVCLAYVPDAVVGDWAIVHVGFAITRLDETAAAETLDLLRRMGGLDDGLDVQLDDGLDDQLGGAPSSSPGEGPG